MSVGAYLGSPGHLVKFPTQKGVAMSLNTLRDRLAGFCCDINHHARVNGFRSQVVEVGSGWWTAQSGPSVTVHGKMTEKNSNHRTLLNESLLEACCGGICDISRLIHDLIPALDSPKSSLRLDVIRSGAGTSVISTTWHGLQIGPRYGLPIDEMVEKIRRLADHLSHLGKPGTRIFLVNNKEVPGTDPIAAYRIWAAILQPKLLAPGAGCGDIPRILEVFDDTACRAARDALQAQ